MEQNPFRRCPAVPFAAIFGLLRDRRRGGSDSTVLWIPSIAVSQWNIMEHDSVLYVLSR